MKRRWSACHLVSVSRYQVDSAADGPCPLTPATVSIRQVSSSMWPARRPPTSHRKADRIYITLLLSQLESCVFGQSGRGSAGGPQRCFRSCERCTAAKVACLLATIQRYLWLNLAAWRQSYKESEEMLMVGMLGDNCTKLFSQQVISTVMLHWTSSIGYRFSMSPSPLPDSRQTLPRENLSCLSRPSQCAAHLISWVLPDP